MSGPAESIDGPVTGRWRRACDGCRHDVALNDIVQLRGRDVSPMAREVAVGSGHPPRDVAENGPCESGDRALRECGIEGVGEVFGVASLGPTPA